ncbi:MAG TPA: hypothetical protein VFY06_11320 [Verrucomicrobiae bacterium]|nr:hypothetical protein [Verrucomicrobiae bacterium]
MNTVNVVALITGLVQLAVAGYALRLNRLFGVARAGWSLFWAFFLMALLHLVEPSVMAGGAAETGIPVGVMYALISMLLLVSMVHLETVLKERTRAEREEKRLRTELEWEVQKKTAYLMRALEELQAETDGRKQAEAEVEVTQDELRTVFRRLKSAEVTASVLRCIGNTLRSVNASASLISDRVKQSKIANVVHIGALIREHTVDLNRFMTQDPRGQKLPVYIMELGKQLAGERAALSSELESIRKNIEHIKSVLAMHQKCANHTHLNERKEEASLACAEPACDPKGLTAVAAGIAS